MRSALHRWLTGEGGYQGSHAALEGGQLVPAGPMQKWAEPCVRRISGPRHVRARLRQLHSSIKSLHVDSQLTSVCLSKPHKPHPPQRCTARQGGGQGAVSLARLGSKDRHRCSSDAHLWVGDGKAGRAARLIWLEGQRRAALAQNCLPHVPRRRVYVRSGAGLQLARTVHSAVSSARAASCTGSCCRPGVAVAAAGAAPVTSIPGDAADGAACRRCC